MNERALRTPVIAARAGSKRSRRVQRDFSLNVNPRSEISRWRQTPKAGALSRNAAGAP